MPSSVPVNTIELTTMPEPQTPEADLLAEAKRLLRTIRAATLATLDEEGRPFASLIAVATMPDGSPILLVSALSAHTKHIAHDGRCSILLAQSGRGDPLAHPRLTLVGQALKVPEDGRSEARRRFLSRNPKSELYADFPDFSWWRVAVEAAHLNGGFGRAAAFTADQLMTSVAGCEALVEGEDGAVAHMNADHRDAIRLYATRLLGLPDGDWRLSGLDPEGMDLLLGDRTGRLRFPRPIHSGGDLRKLLVDLAAEARSLPSTPS